MAICSDTVSTLDSSNSVSSIKPLYSYDHVKRNNSLFRRFSTSTLSQTAFSQKEEISRSSLYRRKSIPDYGHRVRGRRPSLRKFEYDALVEKIAVAQKSSNTLSLPGVLDAAASLAENRGTPFRSGVPSKKSSKKIVEVHFLHPV